MAVKNTDLPKSEQQQSTEAVQTAKGKSLLEGEVTPKDENNPIFNQAVSPVKKPDSKLGENNSPDKTDQGIVSEPFKEEPSKEEPKAPKESSSEDGGEKKEENKTPKKKPAKKKDPLVETLEMVEEFNKNENVSPFMDGVLGERKDEDAFYDRQDLAFEDPSKPRQDDYIKKIQDFHDMAMFVASDGKTPEERAIASEAGEEEVDKGYVESVNDGLNRSVVTLINSWNKLNGEEQRMTDDMHNISTTEDITSTLIIDGVGTALALRSVAQLGVLVATGTVAIPAVASILAVNVLASAVTSAIKLGYSPERRKESEGFSWFFDDEEKTKNMGNMELFKKQFGVEIVDTATGMAMWSTMKKVVKPIAKYVGKKPLGRKIKVIKDKVVETFKVRKGTTGNKEMDDALTAVNKNSIKDTQELHKGKNRTKLADEVVNNDKVLNVLENSKEVQHQRKRMYDSVDDTKEKKALLEELGIDTTPAPKPKPDGNSSYLSGGGYDKTKLKPNFGSESIESLYSKVGSQIDKLKDGLTPEGIAKISESIGNLLKHKAYKKGTKKNIVTGLDASGKRAKVAGTTLEQGAKKAEQFTGSELHLLEGMYNKINDTVLDISAGLGEGITGKAFKNLKKQQRLVELMLKDRASKAGGDLKAFDLITDNLAFIRNATVDVLDLDDRILQVGKASPLGKKLLKTRAEIVDMITVAKKSGKLMPSNVYKAVSVARSAYLDSLLTSSHIVALSSNAIYGARTILQNAVLNPKQIPRQLKTIAKDTANTMQFYISREGRQFIKDTFTQGKVSARAGQQMVQTEAKSTGQKIVRFVTNTSSSVLHLIDDAMRSSLDGTYTYNAFNEVAYEMAEHMAKNGKRMTQRQADDLLAQMQKGELPENVLHAITNRKKQLLAGDTMSQANTAKSDHFLVNLLRDADKTLGKNLKNVSAGTGPDALSTSIKLGGSALTQTFTKIGSNVLEKVLSDSILGGVSPSVWQKAWQRVVKKQPIMGKPEKIKQALNVVGLLGVSNYTISYEDDKGQHIAGYDSTDKKGYGFGVRKIVHFNGLKIDLKYFGAIGTQLEVMHNIKTNLKKAVLGADYSDIMGELVHTLLQGTASLVNQYGGFEQLSTLLVALQTGEFDDFKARSVLRALPIVGHVDIAVEGIAGKKFSKKSLGYDTPDVDDWGNLPIGNAFMNIFPSSDDKPIEDRSFVETLLTAKMGVRDNKEIKNTRVKDKLHKLGAFGGNKFYHLRDQKTGEDFTISDDNIFINKKTGITPTMLPLSKSFKYGELPPLLLEEPDFMHNKRLLAMNPKYMKDTYAKYFKSGRAILNDAQGTGELLTELRKAFAPDSEGNPANWIEVEREINKFRSAWGMKKDTATIDIADAILQADPTKKGNDEGPKWQVELNSAYKGIKSHLDTNALKNPFGDLGRMPEHIRDRLASQLAQRTLVVEYYNGVKKITKLFPPPSYVRGVLKSQGQKGK